MPKIYRVKGGNGAVHELELLEKSKTTLVFKERRTGQIFKVSVERADGGRYVLNINGERVYVHSSEQGVYVNLLRVDVSEVEFEVVEEKQVKHQARVVQEQNVVSSPLTGRVVEVKVKPGMRVNQGDTVVLIESMKMIIEVKTHIAGVVEEVFVEPGRAVNKGEKLVRIRPS
jgi:biotin carboxyl carrier protein